MLVSNHSARRTCAQSQLNDTTLFSLWLTATSCARPWYFCFCYEDLTMETTFPPFIPNGNARAQDGLQTALTEWSRSVVLTVTRATARYQLGEEGFFRLFRGRHEAISFLRSGSEASSSSVCFAMVLLDLFKADNNNPRLVPLRRSFASPDNSSISESVAVADNAAASPCLKRLSTGALAYSSTSIGQAYRASRTAKDRAIMSFVPSE